MTMAEKIMMLRKKNGWSQEELAERLDVTRQSVSKWEGAQSVPDLDKIIRLSEIFDVTTDYLLKDNAAEAVQAEPQEETPPSQQAEWQSDEAKAENSYTVPQTEVHAGQNGKRRTGIFFTVFWSVYWPAVTAIYLVYSFATNHWGKSWIIWPVFALLFAVVNGVASAMGFQREKPRR